MTIAARLLWLQLAKELRLHAPLVAAHPVLEAEVVYAARHEFCETATDFLARRSRLVFLDVAAARKARRTFSRVSHRVA